MKSLVTVSKALQSLGWPFKLGWAFTPELTRRRDPTEPKPLELSIFDPPTAGHEVHYSHGKTQSCR